jgi:hypothetical protein
MTRGLQPFVRADALEADSQLLSLRNAVRTLNPDVVDGLLPRLCNDATALTFLEDEAVPYLCGAFMSAAERTRSAIVQILLKVLSALDTEELVINLILKFAPSRDCQAKFLAIALLPLVNHTGALRNAFLSLTLDRDAAVRCAVIRALPDCGFDTRTLEAFLRNAVRDRRDEIRIAAAEVLPCVAPHFAAEYCELLQNRGSCAAALAGLPQMITAAGLKRLYQAVLVACDFRPNEAVEALLGCRDSCSTAEKQMLFGVFQKLRRSPLFQKNIGTFVRWFEEKAKFVTLVEFNASAKWREKIGVLQQCIELVPFVGAALADFACQFAQDGVAIIRDRSVDLWVAMIRADLTAIGALARLMEKGWQTRMVVAKVVAAVGVTNGSEGIARQLSCDEVRNVRFCLAARVRKADEFPLLFGGSQDAEIMAL